jgi:protein-S-isoprenylcysteine O-methyltransferase Ste14
MSRLELRVPPPVYAVALGLLMWMVSIVTPDLDLVSALRVGVSIVLLCAALGLGSFAVISFSRARTTIHPLNPEHSTAIVTTGVYRVTRNPMYLAMLLGLLAIGVMLGNLFAVAVACCFVPLITRVQIRPEERILAGTFGDSYRDYCRTVRRWL